MKFKKTLDGFAVVTVAGQEYLVRQDEMFRFVWNMKEAQAKKKAVFNI